MQTRAEPSLLGLCRVQPDNAAKLQDNFAEIAQLVEHNLAKVGVASPSLVFRSSEFFDS